jgi:hypothetical protein
MEQAACRIDLKLDCYSRRRAASWNCIKRIPQSIDDIKPLKCKQTKTAAHEAELSYGTKLYWQRIIQSKLYDWKKEEI